MRDLRRNLMAMYYADVATETDAVDENGYYTGEKTVTYTTPTAIRLNYVEAKSGEYGVDEFGSIGAYDGTIVTARHDCPIDEDSVLWIKSVPPAPHDYVVVRKCESIDGTRYAIRKVGTQ